MSLCSILCSKRTHVTVLYCASFICLGLALAQLGPALLELSRRCHTPVSSLGILFTVRAIGYLFGTTLGGALNSHYDGHHTLTAALLTGAVSSAYLAYVDTLLYLTLLITVQGIALGLLDNCCNVMIFWLHQRDPATSSYMQLLHSFIGVGQFISPLLIGYMSEIYGGSITYSFLTIAASFTPIIVLLQFYSSPQPFRPSRLRKTPPARTRTIHRGTHTPARIQRVVPIQAPVTPITAHTPIAAHTPLIPHTLQQQQQQHSFQWPPAVSATTPLVQTPVRHSYSSVETRVLTVHECIAEESMELPPEDDEELDYEAALSNRGCFHAICAPLAGFPCVDQLLLLQIAAFLFFYIGAEVGTGGYIYTYSILLHMSDALTSSYLSSLYWFSLTVGRVIAIPMALRVPPSSMLLANLIGCAVSCSIVLYDIHNLQLLWVGTAIYGLSMASSYPSAVLLARSYLGHLSGGMTSFLVCGSCFGEMVLPFVMMQAFMYSGYACLFYMLAAITCLCTVFFIMIKISGTYRSPKVMSAYHTAVPA